MALLSLFQENSTGESTVIIFFTLVAVVALVLVVLGLSGVLPFGRKNQGAEIGAALRELLLARAEGKVGGEEFERRQAALHASLMDLPQKNVSAMRRHLRWAVPALIVIVAVPPVVLYTYFGKPKAVEISSSPAPVAPSGMRAPEAKSQPQANSGGDLNMVVKRLADKMVKDPNNGEGWLLLARTYGELRQHKEAANAYAKAAALLPPDAALLADWADAYVMTQDRKWNDQARDIVKRALAANPKHLKSLALAGGEAFDRADYKTAIDYWKRIKAVAPADSMDAKLADSNIAEATARMSGKKPEA
jgi:cytochrome c-type biogenesis protein CcmH